MKLCYTLCMIWWFLHIVQSKSLEDNLKESENRVIEEQALETPELEDADIEKQPMEEPNFEDAIWEEEYLEDADIEKQPLEEPNFEDAIWEEEYLEELEIDDFLRAMSLNEYNDKENAALVGHHTGLEFQNQDGVRKPTVPIHDKCGQTRFQNDFSRWTHSTILSIGHHRACGPYTKHYSDTDCPVVCIRYGISVQKCEDICQPITNCTAYNWSGRGNLGCVLRNCGGGTPPYPTGVNPDWVSFSYIKAAGVPQCQRPDGEDINL